MTFAEKILYLRKEKGIQQNQLAKELNVSRQSIYKWESGVCMPELDKIKKMAEIFEVSYDVLLSDDISLFDNEPSEKQEKKKSFKNNLILVIIAISVVLIAFFIGFIIFNSLNEDNYEENTDTSSKDTQSTIQHTEAHEMEIVTIYSYATCEKEGMALMHCYECEYKKVAKIKPKGHQLSSSGICEECGYFKGTDGIEYATGNGYGGCYYVKSIGNCSEKDIVISNMYNGKKVVAIKSEAFKNTNITSIVLPDTITTIEASAFYACTSLSSIKFSEGLMEIGEYAFYQSGLKELELPNSLEKISEYAFYDSKITSVHFGSELKYIGYSAFAKCPLNTVKYDGTGYWEIPNTLSKNKPLNSQTFPSNTTFTWKKQS